MKKIAITGPESTGKTSLAAGLAEQHACIWVPEYAREYLEVRHGAYDKDDLINILDGQLLRMEFASQADVPYLFFDTEVLVLKIWHEFKYGVSDPLIDAAWNSQEMDTYFLCDTDIPWEEDPLRENPHDRALLLELYKKALEQSGRSYFLISGTLEQRLKKATSLLSSYHS